MSKPHIGLTQKVPLAGYLCNARFLEAYALAWRNGLSQLGKRALHAPMRLAHGDYKLGLKESADYPGVYYRQRDGHTVVNEKSEWQVNLYFRPPSFAGKDPFGHVWADFGTKDKRDKASLVANPNAIGAAIQGHGIDHSEGKLVTKNGSKFDYEAYGADYAITINLQSATQLKAVENAWSQVLQKKKYNLYNNNCMSLIDDLVDILKDQKLLTVADLKLINHRRNDSILVPGNAMQQMRAALIPNP